MKYDNIKPPCVDSPTDSKKYVNVEAVYLALTLCRGIDGRYHFRIPLDDGNRPWRFVIEDLLMDGLVLPIATEAEYFKKEQA